MDREARPVGRRAFLGLVLGGLSAFAWAGPASRVLSPLTSGFAQLGANLLPLGGWGVGVGGLVKRPREFSLADLQALPRAEQVSTFHCVTGWTVDDVHWAGVRFRDLLAEVEPLPSAHAIRFVSAERPYEDSLTLPQALLGDTML